MANIWKLKQDVCAVGRRIYDRGLVAAFEGNISVRLAADRVLCTPSLVCKGDLKPEDLCVVDMTGKQIDGSWSGYNAMSDAKSTSSAGRRKRSSEILLHLAVYGARPDVQAVVHTHPPHAVAFAMTHTAIPKCVTAEVEVFLGEVPIAPYATPGTAALGESILPYVHDANAVVLSNHGAVSWGGSLDEALHRTEILESYCRTLILARQLGPIQRLSDVHMRELLAIKQKLGLPDRRLGQETFEDCDLCGNGVFGRGFCDAAPAACEAGTPAIPSGPPAPQRSATIDQMVRDITDRVWAEMNARGSTNH